MSRRDYWRNTCGLRSRLFDFWRCYLFESQRNSPPSRVWKRVRDFNGPAECHGSVHLPVDRAFQSFSFVRNFESGDAFCGVDSSLFSTSLSTMVLSALCLYVVVVRGTGRSNIK